MPVVDIVSLSTRSIYSSLLSFEGLQPHRLVQRQVTLVIGSADPHSALWQIQGEGFQREVRPGCLF